MKTLFEISRSGLRSAERSLAVTSNNLINADTPGYSRQRVEKSPIGMQMSDRHAGLGVRISAVNRLRNEMADTQMLYKKQTMGYLQSQKSIFDQLEASMASDTGIDLDLHISKLFDSFSELSSDPQDASVRNNLLASGQQLTQKLRAMSSNMDETSEVVRQSATQTVTRINELLGELASLNQSVVTGQVSGRENHASLDQQIHKLEQLSELVDFETLKSDNGSLQIRIGGVKVVEEGEASLLKPEVDDVDKNFRLRLQKNGKAVDVNGGRLGGEIEMYESGIPEIRQRLDKIAESIVEEFNEVHSQGYGLDDNTQRNFFNPANTTAADIEINEAIRLNHRHIAASSVAEEAGNGAIAADIAELRNVRVLEGRKLVDYAVDLISSPGTELTRLSAGIEATDSEMQMLSIQQQQESGVNVDEELSKMIKYQNAYQGAARVMSAAQDMYDTLIGIVR